MGQPLSREQEKKWIRSNCDIDKLAFSDLTLDNCLIQFSGLQSNTVLRKRSVFLFKNFPIKMREFVTHAKPLTGYPNAVGIGAFFILWMIEANLDVAGDNFSTMLNSMFVKEKGNEVFNIVRAYYKRFKMFVHDSTELKRETRIYERKLGDQLTSVGACLLNGDMSTALFKVWVNGAAFHIQMLIHLVRLEGGDRQTVSEAIDGYQKELGELVDEFTLFKDRSVKMESVFGVCDAPCYCRITDCESDKYILPHWSVSSELVVKVLLELDKQIPLLINYFSDTQRNLDALIEMDQDFEFPKKK